MSSMDCNETCCSWGDGHVMCFSDNNFTDRSNLTYTPPWELGIRWTFTIFITSVGFFGNLAIIIILFSNRLLLRTSINRFILNMSCADFILTCAGPVFFTIKDTHQFYVLGNLWCHLDGYIQILVMVVSALSLSVISCDRVLGIIRPFHRHLKIWQSDVVILVIWVLAAAFAIPFMIYRVYTVREWKDLTQTVCGESAKMKGWWIFTLVVLIWIPVAAMLISYGSIMFFLLCSKMRLRREEHPAILRLKKRVIRMMFIVVLGFIICWGPFQGSRIYSFFCTSGGQYTDPKAGEKYELFNTISQYMLYINPAFNPIVYGLMHQTFRRAFKITFPCFFNKKSSFVLMRGQGHQRYVWSVKSSTSAAYGQIMNNDCRQMAHQRKRCGRGTTPVALLASSSTVAAIALDPMRSFSSLPGDGDGKEEDSMKSSIVSVERTMEMTTLSIDDEEYVRNISIHMERNRRRSVASRGALGHLITQVIEEESSSDVDSERIL